MTELFDEQYDPIREEYVMCGIWKPSNYDGYRFIGPLTALTIDDSTVIPDEYEWYDQNIREFTTNKHAFYLTTRGSVPGEATVNFMFYLATDPQDLIQDGVIDGEPEPYLIP